MFYVDLRYMYERGGEGGGKEERETERGEEREEECVFTLCTPTFLEFPSLCYSFLHCIDDLLQPSALVEE